MQTFLYVGIFGMAGVLVRYITHGFFHHQARDFPVATFSLNIIGSLIIGVVYGYAQKKGFTSHPVLVGASIGFLGGLTTFSSYAFDSLRLIQNGAMGTFALYFLLSPTVALLFTFVGFKLSGN